MCTLISDVKCIFKNVLQNNFIIKANTMNPDPIAPKVPSLLDNVISTKISCGWSIY